MIQSRYGWTDEYLLEKLPYARLLEVARVASLAALEEERSRWRRVAFAVWMLMRIQVPLDQFYAELGLGGGEAPGPKAERITAKEALARAEEILKRFREGPGGS